MSTGGTGGRTVQGLTYGSSAVEQTVDLSDDPDPKGTAAGYVGFIYPNHLPNHSYSNI